jgi:hypothetical protein
LRERLAVLVETAEPNAATRLSPYLAALAEAPNPASTLRWLATPTFVLLDDLLSGRTEINHDALDQRQVADRPPGAPAVAFVRAALVCHGVLEAREEAAVSFEQWLRRAITRLDLGPDRAKVKAYASWQVAQSLSRTKERRQPNPGAQKYARSLVNEAIKLIESLHAHDLTLAELRQDTLDAWIAAGASTRRRVRLFLAWAARTGGAPPLHVAWSERGPSPGPLDEERRLAALRRLLHGEDADPRDRLAGCLLLLFGQPLTRTAALRADDVCIDAEGRPTLRIGRGALALPEPLAGVAVELRRRSLARGGDGAWPMPGRKAGTHLSAARLLARLRHYDISARAARHGALLELAARLPAPILAERFGLHPHRAAQWVRVAGDTYADYVALRARSSPSAELPTP